MSVSVQQVPIQVQVSDPSAAKQSDGQITNLLGGPQGQLVADSLHGQYYQQTSRGNVFIGSTSKDGVAIPIYNATAAVFALWNPTGSGKNAVPLSITFGMGTVGTKAVSGIGLSYKTSCGSAIATGAPISAFTDGTPVNALLGSGKTSVMRFAPGAATIVAGAHLLTFGLSVESATAGNGTWFLQYEFKGQLILGPGSLIHVTSAPVACGSTYLITLVWEEVPA